MRLEITFLFLVLLGTASPIGCTASRQREPEHKPTDLSREQVEGIAVSLRAAPTTVSPGETIHFTASSYNSTSQRIQIGMQCGPPLDVLVTRPDGTRLSVLVDRYAGAGVIVGFTCALTEAHFADPGETKTDRLEWQAPVQRGEYTAAAGLRRADGLGNLSAPVRLTVR